MLRTNLVARMAPFGLHHHPYCALSTVLVRPLPVGAAHDTFTHLPR